jgi:hypothetical protein
VSLLHVSALTWPSSGRSPKRNIIMADFVTDVHMWSQNILFSIKVFKIFKI